MFGDRKTLHSSIRTLSLLWNMEMVFEGRIGPVLLQLGQDSLPSLLEEFSMNYTSEFERKMSGSLAGNYIFEIKWVMQQDNNLKHTSLTKIG